jgi:hypothetical protein
VRNGVILPKVNCGACENAAGVEPSVDPASVDPDVSGDTPVAFGRCKLAPITLLLFGCVTASGNPVCRMPTALADHPPAIRFSMRPLFRNGFPFPNGSS